MLQEALDILKGSRAPLFLTSAGMSAESGIPTFRDKEGFWRNFPPFVDKGLYAESLASPWAFDNHLDHAWAFYEWRRRNAAHNEPHGGYGVIRDWLVSGRFTGFVHTTNTDGYHLRSGLPEGLVREVHGSMWRLQCLGPCSKSYWDEPRVPLCDLDESTMRASNFPRCEACGSVARPHILMFNDFGYVGHPAQDRDFIRFIDTAGVDAALLVGSSGEVPTNDYMALKMRELFGAKIIVINPDPNANPGVSPDVRLNLGASEALVGLEEGL